MDFTVPRLSHEKLPTQFWLPPTQNLKMSQVQIFIGKRQNSNRLTENCTWKNGIKKLKIEQDRIKIQMEWRRKDWTLQLQQLELKDVWTLPRINLCDF